MRPVAAAGFEESLWTAALISGRMAITSAGAFVVEQLAT